LHHVPEAGGVTGIEPFDTAVVFGRYRLHGAFVRGGGKGIAIAPAHVRHIDAQHPKQTRALARFQFRQHVQESAHVVVFFRHAATLIDTARIRTAQNRHDANIGAVEILQKQNLEFDGVLHGVAIVLHVHRAAAFFGEPIHQRGVRPAFADRRDVRLACQAEAFRFAVMGRAQHDEGAVAIGRSHHAISRTIRLPAARWTHVRRGDAEQTVSFGVVPIHIGHVLAHGVAQRLDLFRICRPGVHGIAPRRCGKLALPCLFHSGESFIFQEAAGTERLHQTFFDISHFQVAGDLDQRGAEVEIGLLAVEAVQAFYQRRRDDDDRLGIAVRIANHEPGPVL
jgi:hypothetical protein